MTAPIRRKLIEVSIPLEAINKASLREKQIKTGKPLQIHHYWARRPLTTCRAILFSQLVDDPSAWPERFPTEESRSSERRRLHKIIEELVPWEASNDPRVLNAARWEIARSVAWAKGAEPPSKDDTDAVLAYLQANAPAVYDPFSGGGSIPLEAQRLGLRAYGSDLNPVAVLLGKALIEIPPIFVGRPPVNPATRSDAKHGQLRNWKGIQGLADDVGHYARWMRDQATQRIGHLYPPANVPNSNAASVIAWIWARTVRSPDPSAKGAMVPLASSFLLSTKGVTKSWVELVPDPTAPDGYQFRVQTGKPSKQTEELARKGTKTSRGQFACALTGAPIGEEYIRLEGKNRRLGVRLMALVAEGSRKRIYLSPTNEHEAIALSARPEWEPEGEMYEKALGFRVPAYGITRWAQLFTARQLVALTTYSGLIEEVRRMVYEDAQATKWSDDDDALHRGGTGSQAYADAIATYLALALDRVADWNNTGSRWESKVEVPQQLFARQVISMNWDFAEANPIGSSTGSLMATVENMRRAFEAISLINPGAASVELADAATCDLPDHTVVVSTDPPYYDNIGYADLSDFFYAWLRPSIGKVWPDLFRRLATPKSEELVATPFRNGGKSQAENFFMKGMGAALTSIQKLSSETHPVAIYYAFKQAELADEGITSAGWASFLQAIITGGFTICGTWPVRTELANRMRGQGSNALASSIVLVCRKRSENADATNRSDFIRALKEELPAAIDAIRKAGVGPVDMQQSVIGPGMGIFSQFRVVLEDDDTAMPVKTALAVINRIWEEIENELDTAFDAETQVALAWFGSFGLEPRSSGELITLANAKNVPSNSLFSSGVFKDLKGKAALMPRHELPADWSPTKDRSLTVWECVQHTARVLNADYGGASAAAKLVAEMGAKATEARALAYRLFEISTKNGWSAEALVYNELAQEWPNLEDLASSDRTEPAEPTQRDMFAS
jgi:putative DNA methylase